MTATGRHVDRTLGYIERARAKLRRHIARGGCAWGLCPEPRVNATYCAKHRARAKALRDARYWRRKLAGECPACGAPLATDT